MTVNELLAELRKLQRAGKGELTVFQSCTDTKDETIWCPRTTVVKTYPHHVVLIPEKY